MNTFDLTKMTKGWFVGPFEPTACFTDAVEVAVKSYAAGDAEPLHVHAIATEVTAVISGTVMMAGRELRTGDIAVLQPGEASDFRAITASTVVAVKLPAVVGDKYLVES